MADVVASVGGEGKGRGPDVRIRPRPEPTEELSGPRLGAVSFCLYRPCTDQVRLRY